MERASKQILIVREDLKMRKGKMAAQCAHATQGVLFSQGRKEDTRLTVEFEAGSAMQHWCLTNFKKIVLGCKDLDHFMQYARQARERGVLHYAVMDSGLTEFHGQPTLTVLAIGPLWEDEFVGWTDQGDLKLL